jgi:tetratricopeptide (TPR) repeat protein
MAPAQTASSAAADGQALLKAGKYAEAQSAFESQLNADASNAAAQAGEVEASERLALQERAGGHLVKSLEALLRGEKYVPGSARLFYDQGILEDEMRVYPQAEKALETAKKLHMNNPSLDYAMARVLFDQGQLAAAAEKMQVYLKERPNDASAHYGLGRIYQLGMQFDQAKAEFEKCVQLQPVQTEGYYQLGDIALKEQDYSEALTEFAKVLARDARHGGALAGSGQALYREKKYDQALVFLKKAVVAAPEYQPGHYYLGLTLMRLGKKEEAQKELATAGKLADVQNKQAATRYQLIIPSNQQ